MHESLPSPQHPPQRRTDEVVGEYLAPGQPAGRPAIPLGVLAFAGALALAGALFVLSKGHVVLFLFAPFLLPLLFARGRGRGIMQR